ncbi:hypothetical protein CON84_12450 [Bacillus sp. AFS094228]|nr:hypothetical protein CON84_12450 [Bacillus sp. AFS094228]
MVTTFSRYPVSFNYLISIINKTLIAACPFDPEPIKQCNTFSISLFPLKTKVMNYLKSEYDNIFVKYKKAEAAEIIKKKIRV